MKASVLAIGTELTTGQITNSNSSWISARLKELGIQTSLHLTVPDDREVNLQSLKMCADNSDVVFVTGGLGPTSDDFTREVIAAWMGSKLEFDEASWQHIESRLKPRGIPVKEIQRQQCYFPKDAKVLGNREGTANGFQVQHGGKLVFVLPGPPREIAAIWQDHIHPWALEKTKGLDRIVTESWDILGLPESQVAEMAEQVLSKLPTALASKLEVGYRVHLPYVELKLSYLKSCAPEFQATVESITRQFSKQEVLRDGVDAAKNFAAALEAYHDFCISDFTSGSFLISRLEPSLRNLTKSKAWLFTNQMQPQIDSQISANFDLQFGLYPIHEFEARAEISHLGKTRVCEFVAHNQSAAMAERRQQYFAEKAILFWLQTLREWS